MISKDRFRELYEQTLKPDGSADFYKLVAAEVFGVPADQVTPEMRARGKALAYTLAWGAESQ